MLDAKPPRAARPHGRRHRRYARHGGAAGVGVHVRPAPPGPSHGAVPDTEVEALGHDAGTVVATVAVCLAILAGSLLVDPRAEEAFDAPKRAATLLALAVGAVSLLLTRRGTTRGVRALPALSRAAVVLLVLALAAALAAALLSPHRSSALDALRVAALTALALPLGASRIFAARRRSWPLAVFLAACAVNVAVAALQAIGGWQPFAVGQYGGRAPTFGLAGNEGYLALACTLAAVSGLGAVLAARESRRRLGLAALIALAVAGIAINANVTAVVALGAGAAVVLAVHFRRRAVIPALAVLAAAAVLVLATPPLRQRLESAGRAARAGEWDTLTSFRFGAWAAALEMVRAHPLAGVGPGGYAAEFVPARLAAELRSHTRMVNPKITSSYGEAHCDYLQAAAEVGIPGALLSLGALATLLVQLACAASRAPDGETAEAALLLGVLVAGVIAALTWFPLQRPITSVPLLLAAGRAWRLGTAGGAGGTA